MRVCLGLVWTGLLLISLGPELSAQYGRVILTELLPNPSAVGDSDGEWIEIFNTQPDSINLMGWMIRDLGSDYHLISEDLWIPPSSYLVLGRESDTLINGGVSVDYEYSGFILNNLQDEIMLLDSSGNLIDSLVYHTSLSGRSMALSARKLNIASSDSIVNWCYEVSYFNSADQGSPGLQNLSCLLQTGDLVITELMIDPTLVNDVDGEWFEIYNLSAFRLELMGLTLSDLDGDFHRVESSLGIESHEYQLFLRNTDSISNGGLSSGYGYDGLILANTEDELLISIDSMILDQVAYDRSIFTISQGRSLSLDPDYFQIDLNDHYGYWCRSSNSYGLGDRGTPGEENEACEVLPVRLEYFKGVEKAQGILLSWETSYEENNCCFTIQRSPDGFNFKTIQEIVAAENQKKPVAYQYFDSEPFPGINYYLLVQMDVDGTESFLQSIALFHRSSSLTLYPNPTRGRFSIDSELHIECIDLMDQQGNHLDKLYPPYSISSLKKGIYILRIIHRHGVIYRYLIKN